MHTIFEDISALEAFLRSVGEVPAHDGFLVLDFVKCYYLSDDGRLCISASDLVEPSALALKYDRLKESGFAWINFSCYGVYRNRLLIVIELPSNSKNSASTSVTFSGPSRHSVMHHWDIQSTLKIQA